MTQQSAGRSARREQGPTHHHVAWARAKGGETSEHQQGHGVVVHGAHVVVQRPDHEQPVHGKVVSAGRDGVLVEDGSGQRVHVRHEHVLEHRPDPSQRHHRILHAPDSWHHPRHDVRAQDPGSWQPAELGQDSGVFQPYPDHTEAERLSHWIWHHEHADLAVADAGMARHVARELARVLAQDSVFSQEIARLYPDAPQPGQRAWLTVVSGYVGWVVALWAADPGLPGLQHAFWSEFQEELKLTPQAEPDGHVPHEGVARDGLAIRRVLRAQYAWTQRHLEQLGLQHATAYRVVAWPSRADDRPEWDRTDEMEPGRVWVLSGVESHAASSWTSDYHTAVQAAKARLRRDGGAAYVLGAIVPVAYVLSTARTGMGSGSARELVLAGLHGDVEAERVSSLPEGSR